MLLVNVSAVLSLSLSRPPPLQMIAVAPWLPYKLLRTCFAKRQCRARPTKCPPDLVTASTGHPRRIAIDLSIHSVASLRSFLSLAADESVFSFSLLPAARFINYSRLIAAEARPRRERRDTIVSEESIKR